jgi:hypothetical protein
MLGIRRMAVLGAAFLLVTAAWATAESQRQHVLPPGTAVVFVTDAPLEAGRREGDVVAIHLRDNLVLDGTVLAPAGAKAYLLVGGTGPEDHRRPLITIDRFSINAGLMPVKPAEPIVPPVAAGTQIDAVTQASVDHIGDRYSIRIPFPFQLSGDQPASAYTPTPARTAPPIMPARRGGSPSPGPATAAPATAAPSPAATKIPGR